LQPSAPQIKRPQNSIGGNVYLTRIATHRRATGTYLGHSNGRLPDWITQAGIDGIQRMSVSQ
jgi:hypothetical protein